MTRGFSIYLDSVRFVASVLVLFSHVAYPRYSNGDLAWMRDLNLGSDAVILFFVLSGFVIAFTTDAKNRTGASFARARMARLYSVVVPALVVTLVCDLLGRSINPAAYDGWWYNGDAILEQVWRALTFSSQAGAENIRIGTNGPFWSVAYEAWYYAAFGIAVFARGWTRIALLGIALVLAGLPILLLAPCWLAGVGLQRALARADVSRIKPSTAYALALGPWLAYAFWLVVDLPQTLTRLTYAMVGTDASLFERFGFADEFVWNNLLAVLFAAHFFGAYCLAKDARKISPKIERAIRWLAGATFSIYLFHYPILTLLHALPGYNPASALHYLGAGAVTLILCFGLAEVSERRLGAWRKLFDAIASITSRSKPLHSARP